MTSLVLSLRQFHELAQELFDFSAFVSCLESVHGRAVEPPEQIDEFRGANLGRYKGGLRLARDGAACGSRRSGTGKTEIDDDRTWTALERNE